MTVQVTDYATILDPDYVVQDEICTPRWKVSIAGIDTYPISFSLDLNGHGATDIGTLTLPITTLPDWSVQLEDVLEDGAVPVQFFIGFPSDESNPQSQPNYVSVFLGLMDIVNPVFDEDEATFDCRSYGSILTAYKITTTASSMTTTQFINSTITQLNSQFGLNLDAKITLPQGAQAATMAQVFGKEIMVGLHNAQVWSVFLDCAQVDDVLLWVDGTTVHYENAEAIQRTTQGIQYGRDALHMRGSHSPQYNRNIQVEVRTWNPKQRHTTTVKTVTGSDGSPTTTTKHTDSLSLPMFGGNGQTSYTSGTNSSGDPTSTVTTSTSSGGVQSTGFTGFAGDSSKEVYVLRISFQQIAQANARALAYWKQLSRFEYQIEFELALTAGLLDVLDITTLWEITGIPWDLFNSIAASGGTAPGGTTAAAPSEPPKEYYARKITIKGDMPQDESNGVASSGGLTVTINGVNHKLSGNSA